jgi:hypothetical protein
VGCELSLSFKSLILLTNRQKTRSSSDSNEMGRSPGDHDRGFKCNYEHWGSEVIATEIIRLPLQDFYDKRDLAVCSCRPERELIEPCDFYAHIKYEPNPEKASSGQNVGAQIAPLAN